MPLNSIANTARSLAFYVRLQEVTANNLANTDSDAFKGDRLAAHAPAGATFPVPVGQLDLRQGAFRETGRPLDVALDGPGFLVVGTAQGERLTRGGSLQLDGAGRLVDAHGDPLLGVEGSIVITGSRFEVRSDGAVFSDDALAGQLRLEAVDDPGTLLKEGAGRFVPSTPRRPVAEGAARLRQGAVEDANVDPLLSMVDLINVQRSYAANLDALKALDSVLGAVTNQVGRVP
jgi:flagellar basal-body rod protein FlgF